MFLSTSAPSNLDMILPCYTDVEIRLCKLPRAMLAYRHCLLTCGYTTVQTALLLRFLNLSYIRRFLSLCSLVLLRNF